MAKTIDEIITQVVRLQKDTKNATQARRVTNILNNTYANTSAQEQRDIQHILRNHHHFREELQGLFEGVKYANNLAHDTTQKFFGWGQEFNNYTLSASHGAMFGTLRGATRVIGTYAGNHALFLDESEAVGEYAGEQGIFRDRSKASGKKTGKFGNFYDLSEASGRTAGRRAKFFDHSKASGEHAGESAFYFNYTEVSGESAGMRGTFYDYARASGRFAGTGGTFHEKSEPIGEKAGLRGTFYGLYQPKEKIASEETIVEQQEPRVKLNIVQKSGQKTIEDVITQVRRMQAKTKDWVNARRITKVLARAYASTTQKQEIDRILYTRDEELKTSVALTGTPREQLRGLLEGLKFANELPHNARQEYFGWGQVFDGNVVVNARRGGWFATFKGESQARGDLAGQYANFLGLSEASGYMTGAKARFERREQASGHRAGRYSFEGVF